MRKIIFLIFIVLHFFTNAQVCDSVVPTFYIDFSGNYAGTIWTSPDTVGVGHCCSSTNSESCISFIVTTDSSTSAILFSYQQVNPPLGPLNYQVDCGPTLVACVDTQKITTCGTHCITCCKVGNRHLIYQVSSIKDTITTTCTGYSQCNNTISNVKLGLNPPQISFYPNPFYTSTTLHTNINKFKLSLYDIFGTLVYKNVTENKTLTVNRDNLANGLYLYQIISDSGQIYNGKLIIE